MYIVGAPNLPFFCVGTSFIIVGISKGHDYFLGTSPPRGGIEGPQSCHWIPIPLVFFVQATLLAPHMGHLNFSLKNAPSRPLAEEDKKRV